MVQKKLIVKNLEEFKKELPGFVKTTSDIEYKKVVAEIMFANNPEEDDDNETNSSGAGCNAGFGILGFLILAAALKLKK